MEIAGLVLSLVQCISPSVAEHWKYHRDFKVNMSTLKEELRQLNGRKEDIQNSAIEGETELKGQVKIWLERVEDINCEVNNMEEEVKTVKYFSRRSLSKLAFGKITEVKNLYDTKLPDDLVIPLPRRGEVLPTTSTLGGETTFKRKMEEIQALLMNDEARKIGVYGMGGIGKTTALEHINNCLLKDNKFDKVIWITVSKESDIIKLQNKIASKLDDDFCKKLSEKNDEQERRAMLFGKLMKMRFLLILDDLWNLYPLESVGIPEPTAQNGCKLVLTTRSHHICRQMSCERIIEMELLSETEASELFFDIVGHNLLAVPGLREIMEKVVQECARLPLAIVTVANSLKNTDDCNKWEVALADLEEHINDPESVEKILKILKFSYDRLKDKNEQDCLLYCALYSEDYPIEINLLIDQLIAKGMVEKSKQGQRKDKKIRRLRMKKCQIMLDNLVKVCLLNSTTNDEGAACLKMHDLIRDMALQIMRSNDNSPLFLVEAGEGSMYIPDKEDWKEDLLEVSLMANNISEIPLDLEPPNCPRVSTMFLHDNSHLRSIPGNFFLHMKGLTVLNLSNTSIDKLPESVSDLVNLGVLLLNGCESLQHVPSLAKLINLRRLDLGRTDVNEVPHGLEMLIKLRYLDLSVNRLSWVSDGVLCKFVHLRYLSLLSVLCDHETPRVREEDLRQLRKLECLYCALYDLDSYNAYVRSLEAGAPNYYFLQLGLNPAVLLFPTRRKIVYLKECNISKSVATGGDCPLLLPANIEFLCIQRCHFNVSNLCELSSFENVTNLKWCSIEDCAEIEHLFSYSSNIISLFQRVETLDLYRGENLRGLIRREEGSPSVLPLPRGTFSSLNYLRLRGCNKIKRLFLTGPLPNLEQLTVEDCEQLVEIISTTYDEDEENQNERRESTTDHAINAPKLFYLCLSTLPELQSIPVKSDSLQHVDIRKCPKLKKIPPIDRETCPPSLRSVRINKDLWDSLEWDYPNAKDFIKSMIDRTLSERRGVKVNVTTD